MSNRKELNLEAAAMVAGGSLMMKCDGDDTGGTLWIKGSDRKYAFSDRESVVAKYKEIHKDMNDQETVDALIKAGLLSAISD